MSAPNLNLPSCHSSLCAYLCFRPLPPYNCQFPSSTCYIHLYFSNTFSSLLSTDENTSVLPSLYHTIRRVKKNFLSTVLRFKRNTLFRICFVFQFGFSFLSRVIIISGVVDRLRSPRLHRYGRNGRRTEWKIAGLRRAIKHGLERPTLLEKAAEVRVGRGSMRPGREKIEK